MLKFGFTTDDGRSIIMLGLTDVSLQRLPKDEPIRVEGREFNPPADATIRDAQIIIFHATRETCLEIARRWGIDERAMLDMIGEG